MTIKYNVTGKDRKKLVTAISKTLGIDSDYIGTPSYGYNIGNYHIDKDGTLTGPDSLELVNTLCGLKFFGDEEYDVPQQGEEAPVTPETAPDIDQHHPRQYADEPPTEEMLRIAAAWTEGLPEYEREEFGLGRERRDPVGEDGPQPSDVPEPDEFAIEVPMDGITPEVLDNLTKLVDSKGTLIKKALGVEELPIRVIDGRLFFPWFQPELENELVKLNAYTQFVTALVETSKTKKRVTAKAQESFENEKFAMRVWMIGLDMKGSDFSLARKLMMANLSGNSSWRYGAPEKAAAAEAPAPAPTDTPPADEPPTAPDPAPDGVGEGEPAPEEEVQGDE